jgi:peptidoglycan/xylan/chitin deacetylase (PgdA/CDA1 family)
VVARLFLKIALVCLVSFVLMYPRLIESESALLYENQVAVLGYHHLDPDIDNNVTITPELLYEQLEYLKSKGYHFINYDQFKSFLSGEVVPSNAVLVTFDDGYKSFYTYGYPILQQLNIPAVNFVITSNLENPLSSQVPSLSREEIKEMSNDSDLIQFQCHSDQLHQTDKKGTPLLMSRIKDSGKSETDEEYNKRILSDTTKCINKLDGLNTEPHDAYAYPYGVFDKSAVEDIQKAGIEFAFTTLSEITLPDTDPLQIPRINAGTPTLKAPSLHTLILNKVISISHQSDYLVPLGQAMYQIGGLISQDADRNIQVHFQNKNWTLYPDSTQVKTADGTTQLSSPIQYKNKKNYIRMDDLQAMIHYHIVYSPYKNLYHIRFTPSKVK